MPEIPQTPLYLCTSLDHGPGGQSGVHPWAPHPSPWLTTTHTHREAKQPGATPGSSSALIKKPTEATQNAFAAQVAEEEPRRGAGAAEAALEAPEAAPPGAASASRLIQPHLQALSHPGSLPQAPGQAQPPRSAGSRSRTGAPPGATLISAFFFFLNPYLPEMPGRAQPWPCCLQRGHRDTQRIQQPDPPKLPAGGTAKEAPPEGDVPHLPSSSPIS